MEQFIQEALAAARVQPVAYVVNAVFLRTAVETDDPTGSLRQQFQWEAGLAIVHCHIADDGISVGAESFFVRWVELLGTAFGGIVMGDRFLAYNHLPTTQPQLGRAHPNCNLTAIAERPGARTEFGKELLSLQHSYFAFVTDTRRKTLMGPPCSKAACRFARHLRPSCSGL